MKKTLNIDTITRVTLVPVSESDSWKIYPATEHRAFFDEDVWGFLTGKIIKKPEYIGHYWSSCEYSLEEFEGYEKQYFLKDRKIYKMAKVYVEYVSGNSTETFFRDTEKAKEFYDSVIRSINNKFSYDE